MKRPFSNTFPGEGSFEIVKERSVEGFYQLLEKHRGQSVAIVTWRCVKSAYYGTYGYGRNIL